MEYFTETNSVKKSLGFVHEMQEERLYWGQPRHTQIRLGFRVRVTAVDIGMEFRLVLPGSLFLTTLNLLNPPQLKRTGMM